MRRYRVAYHSDFRGKAATTLTYTDQRELLMNRYLF